MIKLENKLWLDADWPAPEHIRAGTTVRTGGYSKAPYNDLNIAQHVGDDPDNVKKNRATLGNYLNLQSEPIWLNQSHSAKIISIDNTPENRDADASFTTKPQQVCVVMTADCVPILLCRKDGAKVAAIHAGWRGICNGIIENSLNTFSEPETIMAWIGPCISSGYYEVGKDVYNDCLKHSNSLKSTFDQINDNHWHADLGRITKILLENAGVGSIYECKLCTYNRDDLFFSYRRDGNTGRTASMIWME
jgi:purine-nucleoside/S-methyl-5'-thioadenosine phosphorylase / adenosine deaminase